MLGVKEKNAAAAGVAAKNPSQLFCRKILVFLVFELVFSLLMGAFLVFYGPFENVKKTIVMSWNSYRHQYIAKFFPFPTRPLKNLLNQRKGLCTGPDGIGEEIKRINIPVQHTDKIDVFNIEGGDFNGKLMVVYDPFQVALGYTGQLLKAGETASAIVKRHNAVASINVRISGRGLGWNRRCSGWLYRLHERKSHIQRQQ